MSKVAEKLKRQLITKPKKSVTDLATELGMSRPAVSNMLNGNADLSMELAFKIEELYGIDGSKLLYAQLQEKIDRLKMQMETDDEE